LHDGPKFEIEIVELSGVRAEIRKEPPYAEGEIQLALRDLGSHLLVRDLTERDCVADAERWSNEDAEVCSERPYRPGAVEFTAGGCALYHHVMTRLFGDPYDQTVWFRCSKSPGLANFFSVRFPPLRQELDEWLATPTVWCAPVGVVRLEGPYSTGPFWVDRFTRVAGGFRVDIEYCEV